MNFFDSKRQDCATKRRFGLCDDEPPPHKPAYLDEVNGANLQNQGSIALGTHPAIVCL
jgi:hypothetical protein